MFEAGVAYELWSALNRATRTEMAEGGFATIPHCCSQARCWKHSTTLSWCDCTCRYCRTARRLRG